MPCKRDNTSHVGHLMCFYWTVELKTRTQKTHMSNLSQAVRFSLTLPLWTIYILQWTRQTCGLKKLTGKMEMMLQRNEWISLIGCRTFQRYVFFLLDLFELQELFVTKYGAIFSSLNILRRTYRSGYDELLVIRLFFRNLETEESISEGSSFQEQFSRTWDFVVLWPCLQMSQCRRKVCVNDKKTLYFHFSSERIKFQKFALSMHWKSLETTLESRIDSFLS